MNDVYEQIKFFVNSIWQRKFYALVVAWFVCVVGWIVVATMPNMYQSSARIFIDTSNVLRPLLKGLVVDTDLEAELELMRRTLTSRDSLMNVARLTDLDLTASTPSEMEGLLDSLKARTQIKSEGAKLVRISFVDSDPEQARNITEALITTFIDMNLGHGRDDIDSASQFLDAQISNYERQLQIAEEGLANFKQEKLSKLPNQANAQLRIESLTSERREAEEELRRAITRRDLLRQQMNTPDGGTGQDSYLRGMENRLSELLTQYTEKHPEVIAQRRKIETYLSQPARESAPTSPTPVVSKESELPSEASRVALDEISIALAEQETNIAFYRSRIARIGEKIEELERAIAQTPEIEAEFARLNRDYSVLKGKYEELVSRREQARISRDRDTRADDIKFRVLEPPRTPRTPTGPSRSMLLVVSLFGGVGAGVAFALILGLLNDAVTDPEQLRQNFRLPVFGAVSTIDNFRNHSLRVAQSSAFAAGLLLLFAIFAGLMMVERQSGLANLASNKHITAAYQGVGSVSSKLKTVVSDLLERI